MSSTKHIAVTGATGFLGGHFIRSYLSHYPAQVHAFIRGNSLAECQQKFDNNMHVIYDSYSENSAPLSLLESVNCITGDIEHTDLGLAEEKIYNLRQHFIEEFWHFAASLNFEEQKSKKIFSQNVNGALNTLLLAKKIGVKRFIYISTAYTAGTLSGEIPEAIHDVSQFNNTYEKSKNLAEKTVAQKAKELGIALTICRPSIVIGPEKTKLTGGTRDGLYGFIREMIKLKGAITDNSDGVRIHGNKDTLVNFIPVDRVMDDILELVSRNFDRPIYHLSATGCLTISEVFSIIQDQLGINNVAIAADLDEDAMSRIEKMIQRRTLFYSGYVNHSKLFQRTLSGKWEMRRADLERFIQSGIEEISQERIAKRTSPQLLAKKIA